MTLTPSKATIIRLLGRKWGTWMELKHKLVEQGIIASASDPAPKEWIAAWQAFSGRPGYPPIK